MTEALAPHKLGSREWWDDYFSPGGGWETHGGRNQTRAFAEAFMKYVPLDKTRHFTLLDVGCALGEAISLFRENYAMADLFGIDISETAISRCRHRLGNSAHFQVMQIDDISANYDVIYCSAVLEHFADFREKARHLITRCKALYVIVPFNEMRRGKQLQPDPEEHHQHTFGLSSFDFLFSDGLASSIETRVFTCPGAWSWPWPVWIKENLVKNPLRLALRKPIAKNPRMILYDIESAPQAGSSCSDPNLS